jgi:hypothetical protein
VLQLHGVECTTIGVDAYKVVVLPFEIQHGPSVSIGWKSTPASSLVHSPLPHGGPPSIKREERSPHSKRRYVPNTRRVRIFHLLSQSGWGAVSLNISVHSGGRRKTAPILMPRLIVINAATAARRKCYVSSWMSLRCTLPKTAPRFPKAGF